MIDYILLSLGLFIITFLFYLAVMKLRDAKDAGILFTLHWSAIWIAYGILYVGLFLDVMLNWIVLTVLFFEFPQEFLSTFRVKRHKNHGFGWRQKMAMWFCANFLSPFDPSHCSD